MTKRFIIWLLCLIAPSVFACSVTDDEGHLIQLKQPATRIISLAPDLTELLFTAGAGKKIVGVMRGSDYPPSAKNKMVVASYNQIDAEKIVSLHPDLIVMWGEGTLASEVKKLKIPVYLSHQRKLTDIPTTLQRLGCLAGTEKAANAAAEKFLKRYATLKKKYARTKKIKIFYQIWSQPLITVNHTSWINDVMDLCGGQNIFANLTGAAPQVDIEAVIAANPDVIIASNTQKNWQQPWMKWPQITAVKNHQLFTVDADLLERGSTRILSGMEAVCLSLQ